MTRTKLLTIAAITACAAALIGTATLATAAPGASTAITTRQANFKKMGGAMKVVKEQVGSGAPSKAAVLAAAKTIADTARLQGALFPNGSGASSGVKTDALPAIWTNRPAFDTGMKKMIAEADKLVVVANSGNADVIGAQFKALGGSCGACHKQFRADD